jgi:hypothetical protein
VNLIFQFTFYFRPAKNIFMLNVQVENALRPNFRLLYAELSLLKADQSPLFKYVPQENYFLFDKACFGTITRERYAHQCKVESKDGVPYFKKVFIKALFLLMISKNGTDFHVLLGDAILAQEDILFRHGKAPARFEDCVSSVYLDLLDVEWIEGIQSHRLSVNPLVPRYSLLHRSIPVVPEPPSELEVPIPENTEWSTVISNGLRQGYDVETCFQRYLRLQQHLIFRSASLDSTAKKMADYVKAVGNAEYVLSRSLNCFEQLRHAIDVFNNKKFYVIRNIIPVTEMDRNECKKVLKAQEHNIGNTAQELEEGRCGDRRVQSNILNVDSTTIPAISITHSVLSQLLGETELVIEDIRVLLSRRGCPLQHSHTDFSFVRIYEHDYLNPNGPIGSIKLNTGCSYSFIVALQNGAKLDFYDEDMSRQPIELNQGDMVIWMGNQFHGGSEYLRENIRLFGRLVCSAQGYDPNTFYYMGMTDDEKRELNRGHYVFTPGGRTIPHSLLSPAARARANLPAPVPVLNTPRGTRRSPAAASAIVPNPQDRSTRRNNPGGPPTPVIPPSARSTRNRINR